ncbi:MAG: glycosyltransferase [Candidatus Margulisiibacteriota bacterium]
MINILKYLRRQLWPPSSRPGLTVAGYFTNLHGTGEAARYFVDNLARSGVPYSLVNYLSGLTLEEKATEPYRRFFSERPPYRKSLLFIDAAAAELFYRSYPALFGPGRANSVVWWWEYEDGFSPVADALPRFAEVVVFSDFIRRNFRNILPPGTPITKLKYPFHRPPVTSNREQTRRALGAAPADLLVVYSFDYFSSFERKNPEGAVRAFAAAFAGKKDVKMVLKSINADSFPAKQARLQDLVRQYRLEETVSLIDEPYGRGRLVELLNAADCYLSLHRGEGLGLGMLESMSLGKAVIASNYGGNTEFMNKDNSLLVNCRRTAARDELPAYKNVTVWGEPDLEEAIAHLRLLYERRDLARSLGERAQRHIESDYSLADWTNDFNAWFSRPLPPAAAR